MNLLGFRLGTSIPSGSTKPLKGVGKDVPIPSGEIINLEGLETWQVTWNRRYTNGMGARHTNHEPVGQLFTNKEDALAFSQALLDAYALVRNTIDDQFIKVEKM